LAAAGFYLPLMTLVFTLVTLASISQDTLCLFLSLDFDIERQQADRLGTRQEETVGSELARSASFKSQEKGGWP
jgi:hypothetical protein